MRRRDFLRVASFASAAAVLSGCDVRGSTAPPAGCRAAGSVVDWRLLPTARWPGHQPGRVYLGVSEAGSDATELQDTLCLLRATRSFSTWEGSDVDALEAAHLLGRLPWLSFKPPEDAGDAATSWSLVASGAADDALRVRARVLAKADGPVVLTFHHEPTNDATAADGQLFAEAWVHVYEVMREAADLAHVAFVPVIGEWQWNPINLEADPGPFLPDEVLRRAGFLGIDVYQGPSLEPLGAKLERIRAWLTARGHPELMLGLGEIGCTDLFESDGADWWNDAWSWIEQHVDQVGVVCYFNSTLNSKSDVFWPLEESATKERAFTASLTSPVAAAPV